VRGRLPPLKFFGLSSIRWVATQSGGLGRSCAAARGTTIATTPAAPTATGITLTSGTTTSVFGWCCGLPTFFFPFFWSCRWAGRRAGTPVPRVPEMPADPRSVFAGRGEGRRTAPDTSGPRARRKTGRYAGHRPRRAHTRTGARPGHGARRARPAYAQPAPASLARPRPDCPVGEADRVCLIQPPNRLPTLATMRLACSYWPLLSQCH
jgi:hypothetical protein